MGAVGLRTAGAGEMLWVFVCIVAFWWARGYCAPSIIRGNLRVWSENWAAEEGAGGVSRCGGGGKKKARVLVLRAGVLREWSKWKYEVKDVEYRT